MDMHMAITTTERRTTTALIRLMTWLSPAFPIGAFAYSGGLERAIADGRIQGRDGLADWLDGLMCHGAMKTDAILFSLSYRACSEPVLAEINELALALAGSSERLAETVSLGTAFADSARDWPNPMLDGVRAGAGGRLAYPVAAGAVAGVHETGLEAGLAAYLHANLSQLVSVAIRCGVIGQKQGVGLLASFEDNVASLAGALLDCTEADLGSATFLAEISSLKHETQATRLFRS
jgi:urease accessory protein